MIHRTRHRCRSLRTRLAAGIAAGLLAGCTTPLLVPSGDRSALESWLAETAAPAVVKWRTEAGVASNVVITPVGEPDDAHKVSELTLESVRSLASALRADGVPADFEGAHARSTPDEPSCTNGDTSALNISVSIAPGGASASERVEVTVRARADGAAARNSLIATKLVLSRRELGQVRIPRTLPAASGDMQQPYSAADVDGMLAEFTETLRCDLLRARWRTGAPEVTWDVSRPASWYQSFGLRLRDELARLDVVNGAPGSSRTVSRLELRAEPTSDPRVLRVVVRIAANDTSASGQPVVWHQSYFQAPEPPLAVNPVSLASRMPTTPPVAVAVPEPPPVIRAPPRPPTPTPAQVTSAASAPQPALPQSTQGPRRPDVSVGALRAVKVGSAANCEQGLMSDNTTGPRAGLASLHTGDCVVLELESVVGQQLFVLHQSAGTQLTRVAPSSCVATPPRATWHGVFRVPASRPGSLMIQLTPPDGEEHFYAVAVGTALNPRTRAALEALPHACGEDATARVPHRAQSLLDALSAEVRQGRVALRTLTIVHTADPDSDSNNHLVQR